MKLTKSEVQSRAARDDHAPVTDLVALSWKIRSLRRRPIRHSGRKIADDERMDRFINQSSLFLLVILSAFSLVGCRSLAPSEFAANRPVFDPLEFFEGPTHSWAVIENRRGDPTSQFRADLVGRRDGEEILIEQNFTFEDGRKEQRSWRIRRIDEHHYQATANDVIGVSRGEAWGNVFRWSYTTEGRRSWPLDDRHFDLWMYLTEDGETLINRVTISKFGIVVARTTEYFRRGRGAQ